MFADVPLLAEKDIVACPPAHTLPALVVNDEIDGGGRTLIVISCKELPHAPLAVKR